MTSDSSRRGIGPCLFLRLNLIRKGPWKSRSRVNAGRGGGNYHRFVSFVSESPSVTVTESWTFLRVESGISVVHHFNPLLPSYLCLSWLLYLYRGRLHDRDDLRTERFRVNKSRTKIGRYEEKGYLDKERNRWSSTKSRGILVLTTMGTPMYMSFLCLDDTWWLWSSSYLLNYLQNKIWDPFPLCSIYNWIYYHPFLPKLSSVPKMFRWSVWIDIFLNMI